MKLDTNTSTVDKVLPLFRREVVESLKPKLYGEIVLIRPLALSSFIWLALIFVGFAFVFLMFGHYTSKTRVIGVLLPDKGLIRLYPPQTSTLIACHVHEGQKVRKGDILFELSSDRSSLAFGSTDAEIAQELAFRRESLVSERTDYEKINREQENNLRDRLKKVDLQESRLAEETKLANERLNLANQTFDRYKRLRENGLISLLQLQEKKAEPLEQQKVVQELGQSAVTLARDRQDIHTELEKIPLQVRAQRAAIDRSISEVDQQIREHALSRATVIRAPEDGVVSSIVSNLGSIVEPTTTLASFIPNGAKLEAYLYAPSRDIGFIKPGEKVRLRYQAYPAEKFGWQEGVISEVSSVALSPGEYAFRVGETVQEPMYEIKVAIPAQEIVLYDQPRPLQVGMMLEADILLERRKLFEWIFAPLRDLGGKVAS